MNWKVFHHGTRVISLTFGQFTERTARRESGPLLAIIQTTHVNSTFIASTLTLTNTQTRLFPFILLNAITFYWKTFHEILFQVNNHLDRLDCYKV